MIAYSDIVSVTVRTDTIDCRYQYSYVDQWDAVRAITVNMI